MEEPVAETEKIEEIPKEIEPEVPPEEDDDEDEPVIEPCRLCDEIGEKMYSIFEDNPEGYQLIGLIKENLPIILYKSDPLSKQICDKCVLNLQIISSLKKRSKKTQERYVEKLKTEGDTTDKNVLLYLGCTGSKLVNDNEEEEEEEEELQDKGTSTDDLTILCVNCKQAILDASTVNGEVELCADLHQVIAESLRKNRVMTADPESEKVLRRRKIQPIYHELDDSLCSSLTDLTQNTGGDDTYFEVPSEPDTEESIEDERPIKRRKIDTESDVPAKRKDNESDNISEKSEEKVNEKMEGDKVSQPEEEEKEPEKEPVNYEELFQDEPEFTYEPLTLTQISLNAINLQNVPDYEAAHFNIKDSAVKCPSCDMTFKNVKLLALHEPNHMEVDIEEKIDNPIPWPEDHPFANVRNRWLTFFDENGFDEEEKVSDDPAEAGKEENSLLVEAEEKQIDMSKKDQVVLVDMKPMVNGLYLGDYSKEERKVFYQCMRIGGQTKRFCPLCRYCFKDNWAIESHYFSLACHYTCRYCGMRFNKQRHRFEEHIKEHLDRKDQFSEKIYTASKVNNTLPKVITPDKVKRVIPGEPEMPREIHPDDYPNAQNSMMRGGFKQEPRFILPQNIGYNQGHGLVKIKEEPQDSKDFMGAQMKTQNQAYFCRKCYKVFFKLDEFNAHSKNCDYNQYPQSFRSPHAQGSPSPTPKSQNYNNLKGAQNGVDRRNGDVSSAGRPVRNCVKDIGPYKDEVYIPKQLLNETVSGPPQSFVCHICGTPFPTIYSRNSHMRIHKGEGLNQHTVIPQNILKQRLQQQQNNIQLQRALQHQQQQQHQQQLQQRIRQHQQEQQQNNYPTLEELNIRIKEEPVDSFEPMVEIHEGHEEPPSPPPMTNRIPPSLREIGGGAISLTPIAKPMVQKPRMNTNIMKLVENNPNISISKRPSDKRQSNGGNSMSHGSESGHYSGNSQNNYHQGGYSSDGNQPNYMNSYQNPYINQGGGSYGNNFVAVNPNLMPQEADKTYKCSSCWEAFTNKSHLYFHKKNQCEGSRFPCPFCKKRFGTEAAYSSHIFYSHPE